MRTKYPLPGSGCLCVCCYTHFRHRHKNVNRMRMVKCVRRGEIFHSFYRFLRLILTYIGVPTRRPKYKYIKKNSEKILIRIFSSNFSVQTIFNFFFVRRSRLHSRQKAISELEFEFGMVTKRNVLSNFKLNEFER